MQTFLPYADFDETAGGYLADREKGLRKTRIHKLERNEGAYNNGADG
jgi:hypothetical protein